MQTVDELASVFGGNALFVVLAFLLGVCAVIVAIGKTLDTIRSWRRPSVTQAQQYADWFRADKERLDGHEARLQALERSMADTKDGQRAMMQGVMALLDHELHNGNADQMEKASKGISQYLMNR